MQKTEIAKITAGDIVQRKLLTCGPQESAMGASCKMASQRCSSILVMEGDEVIGI